MVTKLTSVNMSSLETKVYANANRALLKVIPPGPSHIMDLGCGSGANAAILHASGGIVDAVTISKPEILRAQPFCREIHLFDLEHGIPSALKRASYYDIVLCSHVLEHLRNPELLLTQVRAVLKPGGVIYIALPNIFFYSNRLSLIMGKFEYTDEGIMDKTHYRWFSFASAHRMIERCGYNVIAKWAEGGFPLRVFRRILPRAIVEGIDSTAVAVAPGLFGLQMMFAATRANSV
jgi:2-polyprenyl-3-methyl-5-hydroxy-6-metoxy-1,4-benzoquinol methylase